MRFSGDGVAMVSGSRDVGNQANGLAAATSVSGANNRPMALPVGGGVMTGPRRHHALEQWVHVDRQGQTDGRFGRSEPGEIVPHHRVRPLLDTVVSG